MRARFRLLREYASAGIDLNEPARDMIRDRLQQEVSASMEWGQIVTTPTVVVVVRGGYPFGRHVNI